MRSDEKPYAACPTCHGTHAIRWTHGQWVVMAHKILGMTGRYYVPCKGGVVPTKSALARLTIEREYHERIIANAPTARANAHAALAKALADIDTSAQAAAAEVARIDALAAVVRSKS